MFGFNKPEPRKVGDLTPEEMTDFESISAEEAALGVILDKLVLKQKEIIKRKSEWWDDILKAKNIEYDTDSELVNFNDDGELFVKRR